jgi:hypothetical protein
MWEPSRTISVWLAGMAGTLEQTMLQE